MPALAAVPVHPITLGQARLNVNRLGKAVKFLTEKLAKSEKKCKAFMRKHAKARKEKDLLKEKVQEAISKHKDALHIMADIAAGHAVVQHVSPLKASGNADRLRTKAMDLTKKLDKKDQEFKTLVRQFFEARLARASVKQQMREVIKELQKAAKIVDDIIAARY
jgi:formate dehydrogenase maturation protein FdhE